MQRAGIAPEDKTPILTYSTRMHYRDLVAKVVPRKLSVLDSINNSVDFRIERDGLFGPAPEFAGRSGLHEYVAGSLGHQPITYLEFGVWQGASFKAWLAMNAHPDSRFTGFDVFTGLPEDWTPRDPKGTFSTQGKPPEISDPRGRFEIGLFQQTLYPFLERQPPAGQLVVHVDCDLYSSSLFVLTVLDRYFAPGTILIFDDFSSLNHEFAAWCDYRRAFSHRQWEPVAKTTYCVQAAVRLGVPR